ncbi:methyl-accepting chemotaxis protein [Salinisphaera hydrothermalis C41B8]|uniref:Methyl-accepting chemotaxis protein n=1 Tax=Salinisphaera hydrothermalis (strain C41B8) TaxID=1304275 RepID=A0A084II18_SALHC|nr:methyl-accepting chemotaxis protein [Salinisphaera hydrothermalis C41B8]
MRKKGEAVRFLSSVKAKITLAFGSTILAWAVLCALSLYAVNELNAYNGKLYATNMQGVAALGDTSQTYATMLQNIRGRLHAAQSGDMQALADELKSARQTLRSNWKDYYPARVSNAAERAQADKVQQTFDKLDPKLDKFIKVLGMGKAYLANAFYDAQLSLPLTAAAHSLYSLRDSEIASAKHLHASSEKTAQWLTLLIAGTCAGALVAGLLVAFILVRLITRPLTQARQLAESIGQGHLDNEISDKRRDEFGAMLSALSGMQQRLVDTVGDVRLSSESVEANAAQIASGSEELNARTQRQAASLEETAASMEQMTSTVKQNADNAVEAETLARDVKTRADDGSVVAKAAVTAMGEIDQSSRRITDIVGLIEEIAFQTNLLALNASVEAARAGEQGRGFAVVANEVRNLANRSASAVDDIKTLVSDSATKVADGSKQVTRCGEALETINTSIHKVSELIAEIASASREQAGGIEQVNRAIADMDASTQENAALVEQSAAASQELENRAQALLAKMAGFRLGDEHAAPAPESVSAEQPPQTAAEPSDAPATAARPEPEASTKTQPKTEPKPQPRSVAARPASETVDEVDEWATF